jgi:hypothetical protein
MELTDRIQRFIDGVDMSLESAGLIEVGLDDAFPDNDRIGDTVLMLSSYRPGGGTDMVDETQMRAELAKVIGRLR